jgi:phosphoribosylformylglycinamidine synthase
MEYDPMISEKFNGLHQGMFTIDIKPKPISEILNDISRL